MGDTKCPRCPPRQVVPDGPDGLRSVIKKFKIFQHEPERILDADRLLGELAKADDKGRESIFAQFAAISDNRSARRDAAMDLMLAAKEGNGDALLALGHLQAPEAAGMLQDIAKDSENGMYESAVRAMCLFDDPFPFFDELHLALMEYDGLEREAAYAFSRIRSLGLDLLLSVADDTGHSSKAKVLAALEAIGSLGPKAKNALIPLERRSKLCYDAEIKHVIEDTIRKIKG